MATRTTRSETGARQRPARTRTTRQATRRTATITALCTRMSVVASLYCPPEAAWIAQVPPSAQYACSPATITSARHRTEAATRSCNVLASTDAIATPHDAPGAFRSNSCRGSCTSLPERGTRRIRTHSRSRLPRTTEDLDLLTARASERGRARLVGQPEWSRRHHVAARDEGAPTDTRRERSPGGPTGPHTVDGSGRQAVPAVPRRPGEGQGPAREEHAAVAAPTIRGRRAAGAAPPVVAVGGARSRRLCPAPRR